MKPSKRLVHHFERPFTTCTAPSRAASVASCTPLEASFSPWLSSFSACRGSAQRSSAPSSWRSAGSSAPQRHVFSRLCSVPACHPSPTPPPPLNIREASSHHERPSLGRLGGRLPEGQQKRPKMTVKGLHRPRSGPFQLRFTSMSMPFRSISPLGPLRRSHAPPSEHHPPRVTTSDASSELQKRLFFRRCGCLDLGRAAGWPPGTRREASRPRSPARGHPLKDSNCFKLLSML